MKLMPFFVGAILALTVSSAKAITVNLDVFNFDYGDATTGTHIDPIINLGDTVTWTWVSGMHSVSSASPQLENFDSGVQMTMGTTFSQTFTHIGTFNYYCRIHGFASPPGNGVGGMSGHVTVVPEPSAIAGLASGAVSLLSFARRRRS